MAAIYELCEMPDLHKNGEKVLYPRFRSIRQTGLDEIASYLCKETSFSEADVIGLIRALSGKLAVEMSRGHSVKLDGIGVFTPSLAFEREKDGQGSVSGSATITARNIGIDNINFRTDRSLRAGANASLQLAKSDSSRASSSTRYTPGQRLALAVDYLKSNPCLTLRAYQELTGLLRTTASLELRNWASMPYSGIKADGKGTHKRYVAG